MAREKIRKVGRPCNNCKQWVMIGEFRAQGRECKYCRPEPPETLDDPSILSTEHGMALREYWVRWRAERKERNRHIREERQRRWDERFPDKKE